MMKFYNFTERKRVLEEVSTFNLLRASHDELK